MIKKKKQLSQKNSYDVSNKTKPRIIETELVYWKKPVAKRGLSPKLIELRQGPFTVVDVSTDGLTYTIKDDHEHLRKVHVNNLTPCHAQAPLGKLRQRGRPKKN